MKIAFYGTKPYDKIWFEPMGKEYGFDIHFIVIRKRFLWRRDMMQSVSLSTIM